MFIPSDKSTETTISDSKERREISKRTDHRTLVLNLSPLNCEDFAWIETRRSTRECELEILLGEGEEGT